MESETEPARRMPAGAAAASLCDSKSGKCLTRCLLQPLMMCAVQAHAHGPPQAHHESCSCRSAEGVRQLGKQEVHTTSRNLLATPVACIPVKSWASRSFTDSISKKSEPPRPHGKTKLKRQNVLSPSQSWTGLVNPPFVVGHLSRAYRRVG